MARHDPTQGVGFGPRFAVPILIGPALNPINTTMISVALVPIADAVQVSAATVIWLVAGLYLAGAISQPTMGKLADHFGPKVIYLVGLLIVMVSSFIPIVSGTFAGALTSRVLLGVGTSAAYPAAMTLISDQSARLSKDAPQTLLSALSISSLVTASIGPVLGGVLIAAFGWQSIFLVNVPLAAAAFVLAWMWLPKDSTRVKQRDQLSVVQAIDPTGITLFAVTIASALFFILDLSDRLFWLVPVAVVAGAGLVWWEMRHPRPFLDVRMLASNAALTRTLLRLFLSFTAVYLVVYAMSQWVQAVVGLSSGTAGLLQLPAAVVAGVASLLVARSTKVRLPLAFAAAAPLVGGLLIVTLSSQSPLWLIIVALSFFGVPQGLASISNQAALYRQASPDQIGTDAGLSRTSVQLGAIVASSIIGYVFGPQASDTGMHTIGWVVAVISLAALALTLLDRALRAPEPTESSHKSGRATP